MKQVDPVPDLTVTDLLVTDSVERKGIRVWTKRHLWHFCVMFSACTLVKFKGMNLTVPDSLEVQENVVYKFEIPDPTCVCELKYSF